MELKDWSWAVVGLVSALGGLGLVRLLMFGSAEKRKLDVDNEGLQGENSRRQIDWLEKRIAERDRRIDLIFSELRNEQRETVELLKRLYRLDSKLKAERLMRCEVMDCRLRKSSDNGSADGDMEGVLNENVADNMDGGLYDEKDK